MKSLADCAECCALYENDIYCVSKKCNTIFKISGFDKTTSIVGHIPEESFFSERLIGRIEVYRDEMIFIPATAKKIWIWKVKDDEWLGIELANEKMIGNMKFLGSYIHNDTLYMFGCHYPAIVEISLKSNLVTKYHTSMMNVVRYKAEQVRDAIFRTDYAFANGKLYLATCMDNKILEFDINSKLSKWYTIGNNGERFSGITYDGKYFWIAPRVAGYAYRWDGREILKYSINENEVCNSMSFTGIGIDSAGNVIIPNLENDYRYIKYSGSDCFEKSEHVKYNLCEMKSGITKEITRDAIIHIKENEKDRIYTIKCKTDEICKQIRKLRTSMGQFEEFYENEVINLDIFISLQCAND